MGNKPKTGDAALTPEQADKWRKRLGLSETRPFPGEKIPMYSLEEGDQSFDEGEDTGATTERLLQEQISDLKRQLSDSIAREQEIERELEQSRAHADALAECLDFFWRWAGDKAPEGWLKQAQAVLTEHRQSREGSK